METSPPPVLTTNGINHDTVTSAEPAVTFESEIFRSYLLALLPPVIGALPSELEQLFDHEFDERVARFAADSGGSLYVVKAKEESEGAYSNLWGRLGQLLI
jgi:dynein heavy chain 1